MIGALDGQLRRSLTPLADGFWLGKSPRWFEGLLWFSDKLGEAVHTVNLLGAMTTLSLPGYSPCGLGFRPDGSLLIASADDRRILRYDGETVVPVADLSDLVSGSLGEMVVDDLGHAYVGCEASGYGLIARVDLDDPATIVADVADSPAGMVITPDRRTLIVGESSARRLSAFAIDNNGALSDRRTFADGLDGSPAGLAIDAEGGVWTAIASVRQFQRIVGGGMVTDRIEMRDRTPFACTLGGPGHRILFLISGADDDPQRPVGPRRGRLEAVKADVPGVDLP